MTAAYEDVTNGKSRSFAGAEVREVRVVVETDCDANLSNVGRDEAWPRNSDPFPNGGRSD
jgi:hypothetical protein